MLISEAITLIRQELDDSLSSRWTSDTQVLRFIQRAVDRAQHVIRRQAPNLSSKSASMTFDSTHSTVTLPVDFLAPVSLTRTDTQQRLAHVHDEDWDSLEDHDACSAWRIKDNASIEVAGTPTASTVCTLRYFFDAKPYTMTTASSLPWDGRFDGPVMEYAAIRAKNVDEMSLQQDMELLKELEMRVLDTLSLWSPGVVEGSGWNTGSW
jgi:hypothetical protein